MPDFGATIADVSSQLIEIVVPGGATIQIAGYTNSLFRHRVTVEDQGNPGRGTLVFSSEGEGYAMFVMDKNPYEGDVVTLDGIQEPVRTLYVLCEHCPAGSRELYGSRVQPPRTLPDPDEHLRVAKQVVWDIHIDDGQDGDVHDRNSVLRVTAYYPEGHDGKYPCQMDQMDRLLPVRHCYGPYR